MRVMIATRNRTDWPEFAGGTWVAMQYLLGLLDLEVDAYWVDFLGPLDPVENPHSLSYLMRRFRGTANDFGFEGRCCAVYNDGEQYFGLTEEQLARLAEKTDLLLSISGYLPTGSPLLDIARRVYIDVDPAFTQIWGHQYEEFSQRFSHFNYFVSVGQNVDRPDFLIPTQGIEWHSTLPPVFLREWPSVGDRSRERFSTVADWRGSQSATFEGEVYGEKSEEFLRFLPVPRAAGRTIDLALCIDLSEYVDLRLLAENGWRLHNPYAWAGDPHSYREFIQFSSAEFSVAKNGYVKSNSGWISDRTACYLASGKPALVQSTGFESTLPTGLGLLTFRTIEEAVAGIESIRHDYLSHSSAARELAERYFDSRIVLGKLLERVGLPLEMRSHAL